MKNIIITFLILLPPITVTLSNAQTPGNLITNYDVAIVGATPAGIAAAVSAAREGVKVVIIEETSHIGGLASGGLSNTDFITYESVGGFWRDFMDRVVKHYKTTYGADSRQVDECMDGGYYEPKVGLSIFKEMLSEYPDNISVLLNHRLKFADTKTKPGGKSVLEVIRVKDLKTDELKQFKSKVFIDATYEGDLMAKAGCEYRIGSESRDEYNESIASEKANWHVQCYNFRICLTNDPDNRLPIIKPEGYDRGLYTPLIDLLEAGKFDDLSQIIADDRPLPNNKADFNDEKGSPVSLHVCNPTDVWPEGDHKTRQLIFDYIKLHNHGFLYFLQNDPELPDWIKDDMGQWGLPKDEFEDTGHWPPVVYVREGRRMVGEYVFTQHDAQPGKGSFRAPAHEDAVAIGDYNLNSHGTHEPLPGILKGELGGFAMPFQVPYQVMVPKKVDGLLVPVAVSATRVGYGGIRMEPVWAALGEAAGIAASQSIKKDSDVRDIDVSVLQKRLHELKALTFYVSDVPPSSPYFKAVQYFGNRGFFQTLYVRKEPISKRPRGKGIPGPPNHWATAIPFHDIQPEKLMTRDLYQNWTSKVEIKDRNTFRTYDKMTRGEFLNKLYEQLK